MTSVNHTIWRLISEDRSVQKDLARGLINVRGLARYLIEKHHLNASLDAVISAIRRYENEQSIEEQEKSLQDIFNSMIITTKNNVSCITLKDSEFKTIASDFCNERKLKENFRLIKSKENAKIVISQKNLAEKLSLFNQKSIMEVEKDLAEIRVSFPKEAHKTVGVMARIGHEIALHGVNIFEIIWCLPEMLIYVKSKDLVDAHKAVLELTS